MRKRMVLMLIVLGILFGGIFLWKTITGLLMRHFMANKVNIVTVSTTKVVQSPWQPKIKAAASLRAIKGVNVTTELAGLVQTIYFKPGADVKSGSLLVQLNADAEIGQLESLKAQMQLAKITYDRDLLQYQANAISKQTLDTDDQNLKSLKGQVDQQAATVAKKSIQAPFAGRLGISNVNLGQYLNPGDKIVTLQTLNPIWVDFYVPQQALSQIEVGQPVAVLTDAYPKKIFNGKVTTIDSAVDTSTRNVEVEATVDNTTLELTPGMFGTAEVSTGKPVNYLTLPQTAITYNPYGNIVFVVEPGKDKNGKSILAAKERFVITGETRGDQITILKGLKEGDTVVSSGQLKLKNGDQITVNNAIVPKNNPNPQVSNES